MLKLEIRVLRSVGVAMLKTLYDANAVTADASESTMGRDGTANATSPGNQTDSTTSAPPAASEGSSREDALQKLLTELQSTIAACKRNSSTAVEDARTEQNAAVVPSAENTSSASLGLQDTSSSSGYTLATAIPAARCANEPHFSTGGDGSSSVPLITEGRSTSNRNQYGVASHTLPHIETVPPAIRQNIIEGKDVNLALLLISPNELGELRQLEVAGGQVYLKSITTTDKRFLRNLTLSEFIVAFTKYKNIMCEVYPMRRPELDMYERDIVEMATKYGGTTFYEYHKAFSARAAALLEQRNIKVDWSIRDEKMFCGLFAGTKIIACEICSSLVHSTALCPQVVGSNFNRKRPTGQAPGNSQLQVDKQGRPKVKFSGSEICNNFNGQLGCFRSYCPFAHICLTCKEPDHGQLACTANVKAKGPLQTPVRQNTSDTAGQIVKVNVKKTGNKQVPEVNSNTA